MLLMKKILYSSTTELSKSNKWKWTPYRGLLVFQKARNTSSISQVSFAQYEYKPAIVKKQSLQIIREVSSSNHSSMGMTNFVITPSSVPW